ncbi:TBC1 domain family member 5 homolog A [Punica granatum]|uniref:TBC1 domain family member 5 homolog A n=1 Tax=Punica granatum TaxID=22663 RepID=A0A218X1U9_PUNGR|nr:TBC1 domain family member 5 homolog A [Punica granatum]OWM78923.1 hypothetical protein CDL15_Pgr003094 [Punica granatum]
MGSRRRNAGEIRIQDPQNQRARSFNRKPPLGSRQPSVPSWEKQFCRSVGSVPWKKLLETKRVMYLYDNVVKWNDSAGEEAFCNAKKRFYAEINGLPCDISLPDPDKYIDKIDWNTDVDPRLLLELECGRVGNMDEEDRSGEVIFGDVLLNQTFGCTGWGDTEEAFQKIANKLCPAPEFRNADLNTDGMKNSWEQCSPPSNIPDKASGWDNHWNDNRWNDNSWNDDHWNNNNWNDNHWNDNYWNSNDWNNDEGNDNHWNDCKWNNWNSNHRQVGNAGDQEGMWDWNNRRKREVSGGYMSRYKISRFHGGDSHTHRRWRNARGMRRDNLAYQQSPWIGTH